MLLCASPALATGGFECWTEDRAIVLTGSFGNAVGMRMDAAWLRIGERRLATHGEDAELGIARSWLDEEGEIRVDLVARGQDRYAARLRARIVRDRAGAGTLERDGVTHRVQCAMEPMDE